jgi:hypothetical protein
MPRTGLLPGCKSFYSRNNSEIYSQRNQGTEVKRMGRGERDKGQRGSEGHKGHAVRGSNDDRRDPDDLEKDPYHDMGDDDEDLRDPPDDEYIWPKIEEEEDD